MSKKLSLNIIKRLFFIIFVTFFSLIFREISQVTGGMSDYCYIPPIAGTNVKPNVLIVMDYSGSMQFPAYVPCNFGNYSSQNVALCGSSNSTYDRNKTYYGYFDPDKCYIDSGGYFKETTCNCSDRVGTSNCISGNLLNWITTTRIDIARKVLTGGRTSTGNNTFLESEGAEYTINDSSLNCTFEITATASNDRRLTVKDYNNGTCPLAISNANIKIRPSDPSSIRGIIHSFCDTSNLRGQINEKCQLIMQFMVFGGDKRRGEIRAGKNATIENLINAINTESPYGKSHTGEALWEAYDFYKQQNEHDYEANNAYINRGNGNMDPYYDGSGRNSTPVSCRKGFVLLISDGAWDGGVDPVVPARTMLINDLREDLPGKQNVYTCVVYAFGDLDPTTKLQGRQAMITTAIFGGFEDKDGNKWPYPFADYPSNSRQVTYPLSQCNPNGTWDSQCTEWDTVFHSPKDGLPYNFHTANDTESLRSALISAFTDILRRVSSGATVATLTSKKGFSILVLQPFFYPRYQVGEQEVNWIGFLRAFWMDFVANLREDTVDPKWLNLKNMVDKIFQFVTREGEEPQAHLLANETTCISEGKKRSYELIPVFDAGCRLAVTDPNSRNIYVHTGDRKLYPITDNNAKSFLNRIWSDVSSSEGLKIQVDETFTNCLIDYLRGNASISCLDDPKIAPYFQRQRSFDVTSVCGSAGVSGLRVWKLGNIIYSTPNIVSNEANNIYHIRYLDPTYREFIKSKEYKERTTFAFVGANDGMLHAFRIGSLKATGDLAKPYRLVDAFNVDTIDLIGKEEWAFIPQYATPYLIWYGHKDYCHIPTVDYRTFIVDASIGGEPNDNKNPFSWRTLLIGVMGFGGKEICLQKQGQKCVSSYSSSIFVLDLTDWLNGVSTKPTLLWERPLSDKTLTLSFPVVLRFGNRTQNGNWYLLIGSGPKDPKATDFVNNATLYFFDLRDGTLVKSLSLKEKAAIGDIYALDYDNDYQDDLIYFGTYDTNSGNLYRLSFRNFSGGYKDISSLSELDISKAFEANAPIFAQPAATFDKSGNLWIFFGTGRYFNDNDKVFTYSNYLVGFKDPCWKGNCTTTYRYSDLTNRTGEAVNIVVTRTIQTCICTWDNCANKEVAVSGYYTGTNPSPPEKGWFHQLENTNDYKELIISQPFIFGGNLDALIFRASSDICKVGGETWLMALCYDTGIPCQNPSALIHAGTRDSQITIPAKFLLGPGAPPLGQPFQVAAYEPSTGQYVKIVQAGGAIHRIPQQPQSGQRGRFILWIEK